MTPEQAKQLKKGDKIRIEAEVWSVHADGDIQFGHPCKTLSGDLQMMGGYVIPERVSLMPERPKYDPCRRFKKGDKVRVVERHGRKFWNAAPETIYTVVADEYLHDDRSVLHRGCVGLNDGKPETCSSWNVPFFHVELVTPVEELEPYSVEGDEDEWDILRDGKILMSFPFDSSAYYTEEQAKAAAEAECDRLNAEYRKEQNND